MILSGNTFPVTVLFYHSSSTCARIWSIQNINLIVLGGGIGMTRCNPSMITLSGSAWVQGLLCMSQTIKVIFSHGFSLSVFVHHSLAPKTYTTHNIFLYKSTVLFTFSLSLISLSGGGELELSSTLSITTLHDSYRYIFHLAQDYLRYVLQVLSVQPAPDHVAGRLWVTILYYQQCYEAQIRMHLAHLSTVPNALLYFGV